MGPARELDSGRLLLSLQCPACSTGYLTGSPRCHPAHSLLPLPSLSLETITYIGFSACVCTGIALTRV